MKSVEHMTDEQFERFALELLQRELGADGLARFLRLNRSGKGDYTGDRVQWQKDLTVDQTANLTHSFQRTQTVFRELRLIHLVQAGCQLDTKCPTRRMTYQSNKSVPRN